MIKNVASGKYTKRGPKGIDLAKRPDQLHPRIELKALPPPDGNYNGSYVEELD
jgi:hypothetical protein